VVENIDDLANVEVGDRGSNWGTGGMITKIEAARIATAAGIRTVILQGQSPQNIAKILRGEAIGTRFEPQLGSINARKRWIAHGMIPVGKIYLDAGAVKAVQQAGKSLLAAGITRVSGEFQPRDAVQLCDGAGLEIARGIVNYSSGELEKIRGAQSEAIAQILGYEGEETIVHRDNLVLSS
jgi:glutamate 5-kinase